MKALQRKSLFLSAALLLFAPLAHSQNNNYDLVNRVRSTADEVYNLIQRDANRLSNSQLYQALEQLSALRSTVRGEGQGPRPPVPQPPSGRMMAIRGDIENQAFRFDSSNLEQLQTQCTAFVKAKNLNQVDDIRVSFDLGAVQTLKNGPSYWRGANEICGQIVTLAKNNGLTQSPGYIVTGSIETHEFSFSGYDFVSLLNQCESLVEQKRISHADDILVSINFEAQRVLRNASSYWRGSFEICQKVLEGIRR